MWEQALTLREKFGHSADHYYRLIMQRPGRLPTVNKRNPNSWNAYLRQELKRVNEALPEGYPRIKSSDKGEEMEEIRRKWKSMTKDEKLEATRDGIEDIRAQRDMKAVAKNNLPINSFNDARGTLASIQTELEHLSERTGTETMLFAVRSNTTQYNQPFVFFSNQRLADFVETATKAHVTDFALRMEGYCLSGVDDDVATNNIARMTYTNFDDHITAKHGIVIENWPLNKFCNPSAIGSRTEVDVVYQAFRSGTARFRKLSNEEWDEWGEARFQAKLNKMHGPGDDTNGDDTNDTHTTPTDEDNTETSDGPTVPTASASATGTDDPSTSSEVPASSAPPPASSADAPSTSQRRSREDEHTVAGADKQSGPRKRRKTAPEPLQNFVNAVSNPAGDGLMVSKKPRKARSDKGVKRGPRGGGRKENTAIATAVSPGGS
ncbi:hypothetical protein B0H21DRAFT_703062 [Amylocystis lapponica]|nr:hypothetical protein B0H21DRAFT_703062 [Amylocystis lapponica]